MSDFVNRRPVLTGLFLSKIEIFKSDKIKYNLVFVDDILTPRRIEKLWLPAGRPEDFKVFLNKKVVKSILEEKKMIYFFLDKGFFIESEELYGPIGVFE